MFVVCSDLVLIYLLQEIRKKIFVRIVKTTKQLLFSQDIYFS